MERIRHEPAPFDLEVRFWPEPAKSERWNLVRAIPYLRADGTRAGWVGTCTDLTDKRQQESAVRMTGKLALTGRMTSVIAHEIDSPLESITISCTCSPATSRIVEGRHEARIYGTWGQITQVLANLISNAVQAVPIRGCIWLSYASDTEATEITARDNGHGMTEETRRNLFQPLYSTKGDLGNGLGLYISHEIVERHNGSIIVDRKIGQGTDIRVRFPALPIE